MARGIPLRQGGDSHRRTSNKPLIHVGTNLGVAYAKFYPQKITIRNKKSELYIEATCRSNVYGKCHDSADPGTSKGAVSK